MYSEEMVYRDYLSEWLKGRRYNIGSQTYKVCESYIRSQINPMLGHLHLSQLNPMTLQHFSNALKDKGLADTSVRRILSIIYASLNTAEKMQLIPKNYVSLISRPKIKRRDLKVWNVEEVQLFLRLAAKDPYTYIAFHLALLTGMRQGEILGLRWIDVDINNQFLSVRQTLSHDGKEFIPGAKTPSSIRSIALDIGTVNILKRHRQRLNKDRENNASYTDSGLVVCTRLGKKITPRALMNVWYQLLDESQLDRITFHDLRHTHASLLLRNNVHPKIISERLGHSSIQITMDAYSHLLPNIQEDAAAMLGRTIFGVNAK